MQEITKPNKNKFKEIINAPSASDLNHYYAHISHDDQYVNPAFKLTARQRTQWFSEEEVHQSISNLTKTATGPDNIPYWAIKLGVDFLSLPVTQLFG